MNLGLSFGELLALIAAAVAAIVVIRLSVTFDLNRFMEGRRSTYAQKLKNACVHFEFIVRSSGQIQVHPFWVSPPGTIAHYCQRCGAETYLQVDAFNETVDFYSTHVDDYHKQNKRFHKLLKKSGQI